MREGRYPPEPWTLQLRERGDEWWSGTVGCISAKHADGKHEDFLLNNAWDPAEEEEEGQAAQWNADDVATYSRIVACVNACAGLPDPEALRRERDEATDLLRQSVDLISAGVLASVFGCEMTAQAEERINRLVDDLRAFLKKTEGAP